MYTIKMSMSNVPRYPIANNNNNNDTNNHYYILKSKKNKSRKVAVH